MVKGKNFSHFISIILPNNQLNLEFLSKNGILKMVHN